MATIELPLFPLRTVVFPGGPLELRIFEPRYLGMVSRCMRDDHGFGVVLIDSGSEVGQSSFVGVGTTAEIVDWHKGRDGLLRIAAEGRERFRVRRSWQEAGGLHVGELELLAPEPASPLPDEHRYLGRILDGLLDGLGARYARIERRPDDASWVGYRLAEVLPLSAAARQSLLELSDARQRLELLRPHVGETESMLT